MLKNSGHNKQIGKLGEEFVTEYLKKCGFKILERNWHCSKIAEVDIIALDGDVLVFVEVKTRSNLQCGHPFEAVNHTKLKKIQQAIPIYIAEKNIKTSSFRIDLVAVIGTKDFKIEHLRGIGF